MSLEQFSKLSLGDAMVTTRAGTAKAARASRSLQDPDHDHPLPSIESSPPVSPTPSLVISTNNLQYNVSAFDSDLRRRAKRGLEENEIRMKYCAVSDDEHSPEGTKYFYIDDDITVAMGGKLRRPRCDQIMSTVPESIQEQPLELSPDGSMIQDVKPAEILDDKSLASIATDLKWVMRDEDLPEDDDDTRDAVITMLSVFEPQDALPGEFKYPESPLTSERSKKYQEFADLFTQYATRDPGLYLQVRKIIDPDFQTRVFFEKIDTRVNLTFNALDEYITHGPTNASPEALRFDIPSCAKKLRALVKAIADFYQEQIDDERDARDVAVRAAAALVTILDRVTDRNVNAYADITWGMEAPSDAAETNLFIALVEGTAAGGAAPFVLSALMALPQDDVHRNHWETLQSIEQKLDHPHTPPEYMTAFRKVVYESRKRAASEVREGESKRAMQE
ncbi:uncharacterized protein K460DRAFT_395479 [Cucurbitaria berberidis CBS 394.84]|uniref:Uncharacterized protein n=1 Tax=Cucurbitaria berberidis CBS 394.84 TaxID=1168544 RepID=A0A9P4L8C8_9PLEO|nr:uncharacterized protein K460DRAFT_395479 [Cucurbitaria berberidis CBS 394.84]KAF1845946.1 hypothetical protein K460DRAFT_395479 [Cucurbitaria berberidis CBS 394.84]